MPIVRWRWTGALDGRARRAGVPGVWWGACPQCGETAKRNCDLWAGGEWTSDDESERLQERPKNVRRTGAVRRSPWWGGISRALDGLVNVLKWPTALAAVCLLPMSVIASLRLVARIWQNPSPVSAFALGLVLYFVAWHFVLRHRLLGTFFSTLEHELTHALFALATFHPVKELRSTFSAGGHVRYLMYGSRGNWLITISPYFFPTLSFALILVLAVVPRDYRWWAQWLLGAMTAYHITSTMRETDPRQTDLQRVGYIFSVLFLPTANVVALGVVVAFCHGGLGGVGRFVADMWPAFLFR